MDKIKLTVALAGNPNCGKSTIFNHLTGGRQHVGNYPGVTVEKKEGLIETDRFEITLVDLPGVYSLSAYSDDEIVTRDFILQGKPDAVIHILDASNLERNLYLTTQLMELNVPMVLALNMSDLAQARGKRIDDRKLEALLKMPVVVTVGHRNQGTRELIDAVVRAHESAGQLTDRQAVDYGLEILEELVKIEGELCRGAVFPGFYPARWVALKLLEGDVSLEKRISSLGAGAAVLDQVLRSRQHLSAHFADSAEVLVADRRYGFVSGICAEVMAEPAALRVSMTEKIDRVVLGPLLGLPVFALVMYVIFKFTFAFSAPVVGWLEAVLARLSGSVSGLLPEGLLRSLVVDGIISGVGGVLGFFPLVLFMFFAIAFFEDSGYMARAAFVMDRFLSRFGLHGKSFLPLMIATNGCAVPGIMATRILESRRDRLITMMVTPFMICGAKLPIFALFIGAFFPPEKGAWLMFLMYGLSIAIAFFSAWLLKKLVFKGQSAHFVMELPPYRLPSLTGLFLKMWERGWLYVRKAGTVIFLFSIVLWATFRFPEAEPPPGLSPGALAAYQLEHSYAGMAGKWIEPALRPIGMDGVGGMALLAGLAAKEVVVSTLATAYSIGQSDHGTGVTLKERLRRDPFWSPLKALAFLMFCLIYAPCVATLAVFYQETGARIKWLLFLVGWTTSLAWLAAFLVYQTGRILGF